MGTLLLKDAENVSEFYKPAQRRPIMRVPSIDALTTGMTPPNSVSKVLNMKIFMRNYFQFKRYRNTARKQERKKKEPVEILRATNCNQAVSISELGENPNFTRILKHKP